MNDSEKTQKSVMKIMHIVRDDNDAGKATQIVRKQRRQKFYSIIVYFLPLAHCTEKN